MKLKELVTSEREQMRIGHNSWLIIVGISAVFITDNLLGDPQHGSWLFLHWLSNLALILFFWTLWCDFRVHSRQLCEKCVAASPLDPQRSVQRWRPFLKLQHGPVMKRFIIAMVAWFAISLFITGNPRWTYYVAVAVQLSVVFFVVIGHWHSKLQPWCPWCHWDDGGDEEISPEVPDPAISR